MRRFQICCLFFLLLITSTSFSATIEKEFTFQEVEIQQAEEYHFITMPGLKTYGDPGFPKLPFQAYRLVLPSGEEVQNVDVLAAEWVTVAGDILPTPGDPLFPISSKEKPLMAEPSFVYESNSVYPENALDGIRTDYLKGHGIGQFIVHPVRWNPSTGELEQLTNLVVSIETAPSVKAQNALGLLRSDSNTRREIESLSIDTAQLASYSSLDELDELDTRFVIVCDPTHSTAWQTYADFKNRMGMMTEILTTDVIYSTYEGIDNADKVRNALIDYYNSGLEYVLLGGDVSYVPYRGFFATAGGEEDINIPSDLYFAALDGNWNTDEDNFWGEPSEADLYQELSVGRASITNAAMVYTWIAKQMAYVTSPVIGEVTNGLMVGEDLGWTSWGGEYKDEVRLGSSNHGYTTEGFPTSWDVGTLYDMNNTWTVPQLFDELNSGVHFVNHLGHCSTGYGMKASNGDITDQNLTNDGDNHSYYLLYTQGCYCGAFEQNSIMEKWNTINHGAFAVLANSRYGWGSGNNTDGPSQKYDREFFDAIFAENIFNVGDVNRDSKHDNIVNINGSCMRWCYYQINLFGDPSVELYTDTIQELEVVFPPVAILGSDGVTITSESGIPYSVAVSRNNELLGVANSDGGGEAFVEFDILEAGELNIVVTAHNCVPIETTLPTVAPTGAYPVINSVFVVDDLNPATENGQADFGETFYLGLEILNVGVEATDTIDVRIYNNDDEIDIDFDVHQTEIIETNDVDTLYFESTVSLMVEDLTTISFNVEFFTAEEEWNQDAEITLHAPVLSFSVAGVNDEATGNGNHRLDPGETASIVVQYINQGTSDLVDAQLSMNEEDDYLTILEGDPVYQTVPAGSSVISTEYIDVQLDESCENPSRVFFDMLVGYPETEYQFSKTFFIDVGGLFNDVETGLDWTHYSNNENSDYWHEDTYRNSTPGGTYSWKAGGSGLVPYMDDSDICLETPTFAINEEVVLSFNHYMDAEISGMYIGQCYDGGRVEMTEDGETWAPVMMPGYNYVTRGEGPLGAGVSVYGGLIEWAYDSVTLRSDADSIKVRFRFFSDTGTTREGWYIDDISISAAWDEERPCNLNGEVLEENLYLTWGMPDGIPAEALPIGYMVYRDENVISSVLTDPHFEESLSDLPHGIYLYTVSAVYNSGPSEPSEPFELNWGTSSADEMAGVPTEWEIGKPYPNPFNPSFAVKISLPESVPVSANLFNILGQNVHSLQTERLSTGYHTLSFDNSTLSSGIYFLTVKTGPEVQTFKVVMMK